MTPGDRKNGNTQAHRDRTADIRALDQLIIAVDTRLAAVQKRLAEVGDRLDALPRRQQIADAA